MNKTTKNILIVACAMILAGGIFIAVSLALGVNLEGQWNIGNFPLVNINIGGLTGYRAWDNAYCEDGSYNVKAQGISGIDIKWIAGSSELIVYDGDEILIREDSAETITQDVALRYGVENNVLYVQYCMKNKTGELPEKNLSISIPKALADNMETLTYDASSGSLNAASLNAGSFDFSSSSGNLDTSEIIADKVSISTSSGCLLFSGEYNNLDADTSSGRVTVESLGAASHTAIATSSGDVRIAGDCGALEINTTSGTVSSTGDIKAKSLNVDTSSGEVILSGSFPLVDISTTSGRVSLDCVDCPDQIKIGTSSGDVKLALPENSGFTLRYDTSSGELQCGFSVVMSGSRYISGDGLADFGVNTSSGSLIVKTR